ncbi:unnamed protein product [Chironomus riparius]|uniref:Uncharacterized protein n=1 Tax=Chironomus riparius TaxID=315576 RepID=A0A9N9RQB1_9DIPT|nr:unnamed protein product [Chironomus riparius]
MDLSHYFPARLKRFLAIQDENFRMRNEDIEMVVVPKPNNDDHFESELTIADNFEFIESLITFFDNSDVTNLLNDANKILLFKLQVEDISKKPTATDLEELGRKCANNSVVIYLTTKNDYKFYLYWKNKEIQHFLALKVYEELYLMNDTKLFDFLTSFLMNSLKRGHLGLHNAVPIHPDSNTFELYLWADHRNYNLLLIAAELGDSYIVNFMLNGGFNTEFHGTNAQTLAWNGQHFDILLKLLESNLTYPYMIKIDECPDDIRKFNKISQDLNDAMIARNSEDVIKILSENKGMTHFYNLENESAPSFALKNKLFDMYALLIARDVRFGPHEKFSDIKDKLTENEREKLKEIHYNESKFPPDNHMHVLLSNSRLGRGSSDQEKKFKIIQKAFEVLNENPFVQIILMIVAATRNFRIVFDFSRDSVELIDPTANSSFKGSYYISGRIYIGAKNLLNDNTKYEALGTLAHELCHNAMNLVFKNFANPYSRNDVETVKKFEEISKFCEKKSDKEEIIKLAFCKFYSDLERHAELIVRVPHLIIHYFNNKAKFEEVRKIFEDLFVFYYETTITQQMKKALPEIEAHAEAEAQKNKKKIRNLKIFLIVGGFLSIITIVMVILILYFALSPTFYSFSSLSDDQKSDVENALILYKNEEIRFIDLFPKTSEAYNKLTSDDISKMLDNERLNLSDPLFYHLETIVTHDWRNLTKKLHDKFLNSSFSFQNETIKFIELFNINSESFKSLTSTQIINVFKGEILKVHKMIKPEAKFYIERSFVNDHIFEIYYDFMLHVHGDSKLSNPCICYNTTGYNTTFDTFYQQFISKNIHDQMSKIKEINRDDNFKRCSTSDFRVNTLIPLPNFDQYSVKAGYYDISDSLDLHKSYQLDFNSVLKDAQKLKFFILSSDAGTGKTATFEQFSIRTKKTFPSNWVSYINLKDHKELFGYVKDFDDLLAMLENIFGLNSENEFEQKVFKDLFKSGNVILFWNGFDEISPDFSESVLNVLNLIKENTKNIQFLCTRPLYSEMLKLKFITTSYALIPFDRDTETKFLVEFFNTQNITNSRVYIEKVYNITAKTESQDDFKTPLLLGMIAYIPRNHKSTNGRFYVLHQNLPLQKYDIWKDKSVIVANLFASGYDINLLYQKYAMKDSSQIFLSCFSCQVNLKVMRRLKPAELTNDEISQMAILYINGPRHFKFVHRTFTEFFIAQYLIRNLYNAYDEPSLEEAELRIRMFYYSFYSPGVVKFIDSYLQAENKSLTINFDRNILKLFETKFRNFFINGFLQAREYFSFPILFEFFNKNDTILNYLLQIDENETFYTKIYNYAYFSWYSIYDNIETSINHLASKNLKREKYNKFINGQHQKGITLFSLYCLHKQGKNVNLHKDFKSNEIIFESNDPFFVYNSVLENLTDVESKSFIPSKTILNYISLNPETYIFDEILWIAIETELTKEELKSWIFDNIDYISIITQKYLFNFFAKKIDKIFSNSEIHEMFLNKKLLHIAASYDPDTFLELWYFYCNHTTPDEQKLILTQKSELECLIEPPSFVPNTDCYLIPPHNVLQFSLFTYRQNFDWNFETFTKVTNVYKNVFNNTLEIQKIISNSNDFLLTFIIYQDYEFCEKFAEFLKELFVENETDLNEFLCNNIAYKNLETFKFLASFYTEDKKTGLFFKLFDEKNCKKENF